jgi:hypothetical protein
MKKTEGRKSRDTVSLSGVPVLIKQIFKVPEEAPPCPFPPQGCAGDGYEAVRIRVKAEESEYKRITLLPGLILVHISQAKMFCFVPTGINIAPENTCPMQIYSKKRVHHTANK